MFRSSTYGEKTFGNKINLSNTTNAESVDANITADENNVYISWWERNATAYNVYISWWERNATAYNVYISWWERNATAYEPVMKVIHDNGKAFGQMIDLSANK